MADDRVFDFGRIQAQLLHAGIDLIFNGVVEDRVEHDDAVGGRERPHGVLGLAEPVKVVERPSPVRHARSIGPACRRAALPAALATRPATGCVPPLAAPVRRLRPRGAAGAGQTKLNRF